jgi:signal transduction histidine kinase
MDAKKKSSEVLQLERELYNTKAEYEKLIKELRAMESMETEIRSNTIRLTAYTDMLLEASPCYISLLDMTGCFRLSTRSFLNAINVPNFDLICGLSFKKALHKRLPDDELELLEDKRIQVMDTNPSIRFDGFLDFGCTKEKRFYSIEFRKIQITGDFPEDLEEGLLVIFVDNTDLETQKREAELANKFKSDFLAAMSHEIRTPMNAIIGLNDVLARTHLDEIQKKYLADIRSSANTLLSIINDILDFSRIEAGKMAIINAPYNLHDLLEHIHSMYMQTFNDKGLEFKMVISPDLIQWVDGDEVRVRQILTNLISNAAKYTQKGGAKLEIYLELENNLLVFRLCDTGIGVQKEDVGKLFLPFERFELKKNRSIQGTGLGLPISQQLCTLMGGTLTVESHYGEGSCFTAKIPCIPAEQTPEPEEEESVVFDAPYLRVLVVDDIDINLEVAQAMLEVFSIQADVVLSGKDAIDQVTKQEYDVIFMDHMMPIMDGIEATGQIRAMGGWCATVPIIALTANVVNGAENLFMQNGFSGFLPKPLELRSLSICLKKITENLA